MSFVYYITKNDVIQWKTNCRSGACRQIECNYAE